MRLLIIRIRVGLILVLSMMMASFFAVALSSCSSKEDPSRQSTQTTQNEQPARIAFMASYDIFYDSLVQLNILTNYAGETSKYTGLREASARLFQELETAQADMAAKAQFLTGQARSIADQIVLACREEIDIHRARVDAGEAYNVDAWNSYSEQADQTTQKLRTLLSQWNVMSNSA